MKYTKDNYEFVPFTTCKVLSKIEPKEKLNSGIIPLSIKVLEPMHISSGQFETKDNKTIYKSFFKSNDKFIISGSSFKGCVRTIAEMVSHSCKKDELYIKDIKKIRSMDHKQEEDCIICHMFGKMNKRCSTKGKVTFDNLVCVKGETEIIRVPTSYSPNIKNGKYKDAKGRYLGYKVYKNYRKGQCREYLNSMDSGELNNPIEVMKPGSEFEGKVYYKNITSEELKLLCFSLGLSKSFYLKIGYGKAYLLGVIGVTTNEQKYVDYANEYVKDKSNDREIINNIETLKKILSYD